MTNQLRNARPNLDQVIADPLFSRGYNEAWRGDESGRDIRWSAEESTAYERGRNFAGYVRDINEGQRIPLLRGSMAHQPARLLLVLAMKDGVVK